MCCQFVLLVYSQQSTPFLMMIIFVNFTHEIITDIPLHGGVCHKIPHVSAVFKSTPAFPLHVYATPGEDTCQEASSGKIKKIINLCMSRTPVRDTLYSLREMPKKKYTLMLTLLFVSNSKIKNKKFTKTTL